MNDTVEDRLRTAFERVTARVVARPDPVGRLLARRSRRRRRRGVSALAAGVAVAVAGGTFASVPAGSPSPAPAPTATRYAVDTDGSAVPTTGPHHITPAPMTEWTRRLIDGPTRGNLAGDTAYVEALARSLEADTDRSAVPPELSRAKVLALSDVGGVLLAAAALYNDTHAGVLVGLATKGTAAKDMPRMPLGGMIGPLTPFLLSANGVTEGPNDVRNVATIALAPAGCEVASSDTTAIAADGTPQRSWQRHGDHVIAAGDLTRHWWRVTCDGVVRHEAPGYFPVFGEQTRAPDATSVAPRGSGDPATVQLGLNAWPYATEHLGGADPAAIWAGTPPTGGPATVVVAGRAPSGRVLVTATTRDPAAKGIDAVAFYNGRVPEPTHPLPPDFRLSAVTTATAASTDLVAVRLPVTGPRPALDTAILVVAPPTARSLTVTAGGRVAHPVVRLSDGVGVVTLPAPADVELRALDAAGAVLATARYTEPDTTGQFFGERVIQTWG